MKEGKNIQIIEWKDLDKRKFFGMGMICSSLLRFTLFPTNLIKTRLQVSVVYWSKLIHTGVTYIHFWFFFQIFCVK